MKKYKKILNLKRDEKKIKNIFENYRGKSVRFGINFQLIT